MTPPFDEFFAYYFERNAEGEKGSLRRMLQIRPDFLGAHALTVVMALQLNDCATARHEADWLEKSYAKIPATKSTLAFAAACENKKAEALRLVKQMDKMGAPAYQVAIVYALLHDADNAIAQLNKSADEHEMQISYLKFDSFFDSIRSDPRYLEIERRVGLM